MEIVRDFHKIIHIKFWPSVWHIVSYQKIITPVKSQG